MTAMRIARMLMPAVSYRERIWVCLVLAVLIHGIGALGLSFTPVLPDRAVSIEWIWQGEGFSGDPWGVGMEPYRLPASAYAFPRPGTESERVAAEQDYIRRWVDHTERLGVPVAQGLEGSVVAHIRVAFDGRIRSIEVEEGPDFLRRAVHDVVRRAQPHPPFPKELRAYQDSVRISRLWQFGDNRAHEERW